jgi:CRP-like cAMP-binding protein
MNNEVSIALEIFKNYTLSETEIQLINSKFKKIELKKGDVLIKPSTVIQHQYYTFTGCLRSYFVQKSGKENTIQFAIKDWWISDYTALFTNQKSVLHIECLQDAILYRVSKEDIDEVFEKIPKLESFFRKKLEKAFAGFQRRILEYLSLSATERYQKFKENYTEIEKHIKNYHIASFLGITTESLSRIRKSTQKV